MDLILSQSEARLLNAPLISLSPDERRDAFAIRDKIADFNLCQPAPESKVKSPLIQDKDILLKQAVKSPVDGKAYSNRHDWNDHLKRHDCVEVGNSKMPERKLQGDFNCREALTKATRQVLEQRR